MGGDATSNAHSGLGSLVALKDGRGPRRAPVNSSRGKRNRYRSSSFRNREDSCWSIHILNVDRARSTILQAGHLNTVKHTTVMKALEHWANRFQKKGNMIVAIAHSHSWSLDKNGTKAKDLIDKLEADIVLYNKHRQNLMHSDNCNGWNQLFRGGEADVRSLVAHNIHKGRKVGRAQEGRTCILMFCQLKEHLDKLNSGKDE